MLTFVDFCMNRRQPNLASSDLPFEALKCTNNIISTTYSDRGHLKLLKGNIYLISGANIEVNSLAAKPGPVRDNYAN